MILAVSEFFPVKILHQVLFNSVTFILRLNGPNTKAHVYFLLTMQNTQIHRHLHTHIYIGRSNKNHTVFIPVKKLSDNFSTKQDWKIPEFHTICPYLCS